jgi:hypothetical protein
VQVELPGTYEIGFVLEGVFRPIYTLKAAGLLADIERKKAADSATAAANAAAASESASTASTPPPATA